MPLVGEPVLRARSPPVEAAAHERCGMRRSRRRVPEWQFPARSAHEHFQCRATAATLGFLAPHGSVSVGSVTSRSGQRLGAAVQTPLRAALAPRRGFLAL